MARPRVFDEETVLDAATASFWHRGYAATSVRDLADSMRLTPPSLYNAFGDKAALFALVLDRYVERVIVPRIDRLATEPPLEAVRRFLAELVDRAVTDPERRGCLLVNAAVELAAHGKPSPPRSASTWHASSVSSEKRFKKRKRREASAHQRARMTLPICF
jgi:TetR/AcrR family transcriptional regulator, transcriptional repressor for nem operon